VRDIIRAILLSGRAYLKIKWIIHFRIYFSNYPSYSDLFIGVGIRYPCGFKGYLKTGFNYLNVDGDVSIF
jgi:hypothetical protein